MAEKFIQIPYAGISEPSSAFVQENGIDTAENYKMVFYGSSSAVSSPIAVGARIGNGGATLTIGTGFRVYQTFSNNNVSRSKSISTSYGAYNVYYLTESWYVPKYTSLEAFPNIQAAVVEFINTFNVEGYRNIKYNGTGCILIGDSFLPVGSTAHAYVTPNLGGSISESGITVKRAGADVPFTYANGVITFTVT